MRGALLWKRILNEGIRFGDDEPITITPESLAPQSPVFENAETLGRAIITSPIIVASTCIKDVPGYFSIRELPQCTIPFNKFWVEGGLADKTDSDRWGGLIEAEPHECGGWITSVQCTRSGQKIRPEWIGAMVFHIDAAGRIHTKDGFVAVPPSLKHEPDVPACIHMVAYMACAVCTLLSCKNVSMTPHESDPEQVRRAVKRHGGTPDSYRYHTLVVRPPGARHDSPGQDIDIMPRHMCRGHFAEYGPEFNKGLLFGKYAGRFYVPPHMKGDKKHGVVEKDYIVA